MTAAGAEEGDVTTDVMPEVLDEAAFEEYFGLCSPDDLIVIRPYQGDEDDRVLDELRPKYIVMYDSDTAFVRRVEVCLNPWHRAQLTRTGISRPACWLESAMLFSSLLRFSRGAKISHKRTKGERIVRELDQRASGQSNHLASQLFSVFW